MNPVLFAALADQVRGAHRSVAVDRGFLPRPWVVSPKPPARISRQTHLPAIAASSA